MLEIFYLRIKEINWLAKILITWSAIVEESLWLLDLHCRSPLNSLNVSCSPNNRRESICSSLAGCETASGGLKHKKFNKYTYITLLYTLWLLDLHCGVVNPSGQAHQAKQIKIVTN